MINITDFEVVNYKNVQQTLFEKVSRLFSKL